MKSLLTTSAFAIFMASPAFADAHGGMFMNNVDKVQVLGSEFIGSYVYISETELENGIVYEENMETEWENVGDINDVVLSRDGKVEAVIVGVGGFLGLGEKDVAVKMDNIRFISDGEDADEYFVVFTSSQEELENAPEWDDNNRRERVAEARQNRMAYAADTRALDDVERKGYKMVKPADMRASDLIGARVYGTKDEDVGEIADIIVSDDKDMKEALVDVGGFLGMNEKTVAMPMNEIRIMQSSDDENDLRIYVDASQERLEKMPEYKQ